MQRLCTILVLLLPLAGCNCHSVAPPPQRSTFTLLTYNIDAYGGTPDATVKAILDAGADIVCLQEVTPAWQPVLSDKLANLYPAQRFYPDKEAAGVAILSRWDLVDPKLLPAANGGWFGALRVTAQTPIGPVQLLTVHLRPMISDSGSRIKGYFQAESIHRKEIEGLFGRIPKDHPALIAGDFNEGNNTRSIQYLVDQGWCDTLPLFDHSTPTWHGKVLGLETKSRLDHVVCSSQLHPTTTQVLTTGASDHYPVRVVLERQCSK